MKSRILSLAVILAGMSSLSAHASIYGTMSNFDTYNETPEDSYGAEIELEGIHPEDIYGTFPSHYDSETRNFYQEGANFGVRIRYTGYNFSPSGYLPANTVGQSTNGHACVGTAGCEHFGFSVGNQPTNARFYWLDQTGNRIGIMPESIANPTWNYIPANGGGGRRMGARIEVPEPAEIHPQRPDSIWIKVYKTEIDRPVDLMELMSNNDIIPDGIGETETEWDLLEGGLDDFREDEDELDDDMFAVIRRYEYYEYTGAYDDEHEPLSAFDGHNNDEAQPPVDELGQFISANMVAANLAAPEEGDFDQDGDVDGSDFMAWQRGFGSGDKLEDGDANWDDEVDHEDLAIWQNLYVGEDNPGLNAVPEPATVLLAAFAILIPLTLRNR